MQYIEKFLLMCYNRMQSRSGSMAKRGRPSKKVVKRRKELKRKSQSLLIIAVGSIILIVIAGVYYMKSQGL